MTTEILTTTQSTVMLILLKEIRLSKGMPQAYIADRLSKTASYWNKIENGQNSLSLNDFINACFALQVHPNAVLQALHNYSIFLNDHNWYVSPNDSLEDDYLLKMSQAYYESRAFKEKLTAFTYLEPNDVLNTPMTIWEQGTFTPYPWRSVRYVFRYAADETIREKINNYKTNDPPIEINLHEPQLGLWV